MQRSDGLESELKRLIVEALVLEDIAPDEIETEAPLFVEGLGLDSIDALELAMALEERYGVKIEDDPDENRRIFASVRSLAEFVNAQRAALGARRRRACRSDGALEAGDLLARVVAILVREFDVDPRTRSRCRPTSETDLDLDSLDGVALAGWVEEDLGLALSDDEIEQMRYDRQIVELVHLRASRARKGRLRTSGVAARPPRAARFIPLAELLRAGAIRARGSRSRATASATSPDFSGRVGALVGRDRRAPRRALPALHRGQLRVRGGRCSRSRTRARRRCSRRTASRGHVASWPRRSTARSSTERRRGRARAPAAARPARRVAPLAGVALRGARSGARPLVELSTSGTHRAGQGGAEGAAPPRPRARGARVAVRRATRPDARVFATVSHQHLYGLLVPRALAARVGARVLRRDVPAHRGAVPAHARGGRLRARRPRPCTCAACARTPSSRSCATRRRAIFSSGGPLDEDVARDVAELVGHAPIEIFGSTRDRRRGLARSSRVGRERAFRAFPSVRARARGRARTESQLVVRSPYASLGSARARGRAQQTLVWAIASSCSATARFALLGRADRIVKIGEKRLALPEMESAPARAPVRRRRGAGRRSSWSATRAWARWSRSPTRARRRSTQRGRRALGATLAEHLAGYWDRVLLPRAWRYVAELPRDPQGKIAAGGAARAARGGGRARAGARADPALGAARRAHARARAARARGSGLPRGPLSRSAAGGRRGAAPLGDAGGARAASAVAPRRARARESALPRRARCPSRRFALAVELVRRARACASRCSRASASFALGPRGARARGGLAVKPCLLIPCFDHGAAAARRARVARALRTSVSGRRRRQRDPTTARRAGAARARVRRSCACTRCPRTAARASRSRPATALAAGRGLHARAAARRRRSARRRRGAAHSSRRCRRIPTRSCSASRSSTRARRARGSGRASSRAARSGWRRSRSRSATRSAACAACRSRSALRVLARGTLGTAHGVRPGVRGALRLGGRPDRERAGARHRTRPAGSRTSTSAATSPRWARPTRGSGSGMLRARAARCSRGRSAPMSDARAAASGRASVERGNRGWLRFARSGVPDVRARGPRGSCSWPIALYFFVRRRSDARRRRASGSRRSGARPTGARRSASKPGWRTIVRHMHAFACNIFDRMVLWAGDGRCFADRPPRRRGAARARARRDAARSCSARTSAASTCCA